MDELDSQICNNFKNFNSWGPRAQVRCNRMMAGLVKTTLDHGRPLAEPSSFLGSTCTAGKAHSNGKDSLVLTC